MKTDIIITKLKTAFDNALETVEAINEKTFFHKHSEEKWSVAENLQHLSLTLIPINNLLAHPPAMIERWGASGRASRTPEHLMQDYINAISRQSWKAMLPFIPELENKPVGYPGLHAATNKEKTDEFYALTGSQVTSLPKKMIIHYNTTKKNIIETFRTQSDLVIGRLPGLTDHDLDNYQLPLPYMGLVTLEEMLYFTASHVAHHIDIVKQISSPEL